MVSRPILAIRYRERYDHVKLLQYFKNALLTATGSCLCCGDPHCWRFDDEKVWGNQMSVCGYCWYEMLRADCYLDYKPPFHVYANFEKAKPMVARSFVKELYVWYDYGPGPIGVKFLHGIPPSVEFKNHQTMYQETIDTFPWTNAVHAPGVEMMLNSTPINRPLWELPKLKSGIVLMVKFPNNMWIYWNGMKHVEIILPVSYMNNTCGFCGDFNGSDQNDMKMGDHVDGAMRDCAGLEVEGESLSQAMSPQDFVNSWFVKRDYDDENCNADCEKSQFLKK